MEKTAQQLRFEAAWLVKWPNDEPRIFEQDTKGTYTWPEVQDTFDGWQLCEASALERLEALHNSEIVPAAAHLICKQRDEIERLKGLLTIYFNAQQETT